MTEITIRFENSRDIIRIEISGDTGDLTIAAREIEAQIFID